MVFQSLGFWVVFAVVFAGGIAVIIRHERARFRRATQWRGVNPGDPDTQFITDFRLEMGTRVNYVTSDAQTQAKAFVPPNRKE